MNFAGESIAISAVLYWTISVQFFEAASKKVGAASVNIIRLFLACFSISEMGTLCLLTFQPKPGSTEAFLES